MSTEAPFPDDARAVAVDVRRGQPSPEELAALIAVVSEAYAREAAEATAPEPRRRRGWTLSQRVRPTLDRSRGWAGFTG